MMELIRILDLTVLTLSLRKGIAPLSQYLNYVTYLVF